MTPFGITTTYNYDNSGSLYTVSYSDSTPGVTYAYDRQGRQNTIVCNGMTDTLAYNLANELLVESFSGGTLNGLSVTNVYDAFLRRTNLSILNSPSSILASTAYGYDNASRLSIVADGNNNSATYSYLANSPLVSQITFKSNSVTAMTTSKTYDYLNRLTAISSSGSAGVPPAISFNYNYNPANQRTKDTLADGSYWVYGYDTLGQVTNGCKYFADGTPVAGQQFGYTFDTIGNRTQTKSGGDQNGGNQRSANYSANSLNQITSRDVPAYVDIKGVSIATNTVTVNGQTAYRKWEYFRKELSADNSSSALWTNIIVAATGQTSVTGNVFVAQEPEQFLYDLDGNLTNDGRFSYAWDGENRLTNLTSLASAPTGSKVKLDFAYDAKDRRIQKVVSTNNGSIYVPQYTNRFVYDGWNLIAILNPQSSIIESFMWGTDLSGSMQGVGGVGGLLKMSYYGSSTTNCFPAFDGNGNLVALINAVDGTSVAQYDYDPFLGIIRATGPMAFANVMLGSTKYYDWESGLYYYGHRFYNPSTGTWPNHDPINEIGFQTLNRSRRNFDRNQEKNLYVFVGNNALIYFDALGLATIVNDDNFPQNVVDDINRQINSACGHNFFKYVKRCGKHWECVGNKCQTATVHLSNLTPSVHGNPDYPIVGNTLGQWQFGCSITLYPNNGTSQTQWGGVALHEFNHCCGGSDSETDTMQPGWEGTGGLF